MPRSVRFLGRAVLVAATALGLLVLAVALTLAAGFVLSHLLPPWTDIGLRIALTAFAFWFMGKLVDWTPYLRLTSRKSDKDKRDGEVGRTGG